MSYSPVWATSSPRLRCGNARSGRWRRADGEAPGWRGEIRTRSAAGRIANTSGGLSSTPSPSIPACTGPGTLTSRFAARSRLAAGSSGCRRARRRRQMPSWPPPSLGRVLAGQRTIKRRRGRSTSVDAQRRDDGARGPSGPTSRSADSLSCLDPSPRPPSPGACAPWRRDKPGCGPHHRRSPSETLLRNARPFASAMSIWRSTPSVNASRAPIRSFLPVHAHVECEVVACPGREAHERDPVRRRHRGHDRQRPVAAGHSERVGAGRRGFTG